MIFIIMKIVKDEGLWLKIKINQYIRGNQGI